MLSRAYFSQLKGCFSLVTLFAVFHLGLSDASNPNHPRAKKRNDPLGQHAEQGSIAEDKANTGLIILTETDATSAEVPLTKLSSNSNFKNNNVFPIFSETRRG